MSLENQGENLQIQRRLRSKQLVTYRASARLNDTLGRNADWCLFYTTRNIQKNFLFIDKNMEELYMLNLYIIRSIHTYLILSIFQYQVTITNYIQFINCVFCFI